MKLSHLFKQTIEHASILQKRFEMLSVFENSITTDNLKSLNLKQTREKIVELLNNDYPLSCLITLLLHFGTFDTDEFHQISDFLKTQFQERFKTYQAQYSTIFQQTKKFSLIVSKVSVLYSQTNSSTSSFFFLSSLKKLSEEVSYNIETLNEPDLVDIPELIVGELLELLLHGTYSIDPPADVYNHLRRILLLPEHPDHSQHEVQQIQRSDDLCVNVMSYTTLSKKLEKLNNLQFLPCRVICKKILKIKQIINQRKNFKGNTLELCTWFHLIELNLDAFCLFLCQSFRDTCSLNPEILQAALIETPCIQQFGNFCDIVNIVTSCFEIETLKNKYNTLYLLEIAFQKLRTQIFYTIKILSV